MRIYKDDRGQICQPMLKEVEQPVLLIHGHHDRLPTYYVETLKNQLKNCKCVEEEEWGAEEEEEEEEEEGGGAEEGGEGGGGGGRGAGGG